MNKEKLLEEIMKLPKIEAVNPISAMNNINVDDLMSAIDRFDKVPTYDELLKENKQLKIQVSAREEVANKYKDVIEEVRKYTKSHFKEMVADEEAQGLLQILDKAMDN